MDYTLLGNSGLSVSKYAHVFRSQVQTVLKMQAVCLKR